jgi:hypothetical protein
MMPRPTTKVVRRTKMPTSSCMACGPELTENASPRAAIL